MAQEGVYVFPEASAGRNNNAPDLATILALSNNGGFGSMNNPFWMMFMLPFLYPFFNMFGGWGNGFGGGINGGTGYLANQLNNDAGRDLIMQGIQGNREAIAQLAATLNTDIATVQANLNIVGSKLQDVGAQVGMSGLQVINAVQAGNADIAAKLANCCCENRLAICQQTNALQAQAAENAANLRLQLAEGKAADALAICQQTNQLGSQADRNTRSITDAIAAQTTLITKEFCELKERELQAKIDSLTADNALLRSNAATAAQTQQFAAMLAPIQAELAAIKAAQPASITLPNNQYTVVPTLAANAGADFIASYWANRLSQATQNPTTGTTTTNP